MFADQKFGGRFLDHCGIDGVVLGKENVPIKDLG